MHGVFDKTTYDTVYTGLYRENIDKYSIFNVVKKC